MDWSVEEVELIVAEYLQMLTLELTGQAFNKSERRRNLQRRLKDRSEGSIEFKHCNISAVLVELDMPYLHGYRPRFNYQAMLLELVVSNLKGNSLLDEAALAAVNQPALLSPQSDFSKVKTDPPDHEHRVQESTYAPKFQAVKRDYLAREALNRSLGLAGEEFVLQYEHWRLVELGAPRLADRVQHVSLTRGDGLGYDVLSFDTSGRERLIEVKTTSFGRDTPFFISRTELALSKIQRDQFHIYRLFDFRKAPKLFDLPGELEKHCLLDAVSFRASFSAPH